MIKHVSALFLLAALVFTGCQKALSSKEEPDSNDLQSRLSELNSLTTGKAILSDAHWQGNYTIQNDLDTSGNSSSDPDVPLITDADFIKNGVAQLPFLTDKYGYSNISLSIPSNYNIPGDSLIYQVVIKNTNSVSVYDYDVVLQITGDQHAAELHFVAHASARQNNQYYIGATRYSNLDKLVYYFGDFATLKWVTKKNQTAVYLNGKLVYNFRYNLTDKIGRIKAINIAGKGYITIDNVILLNSVSNKKIMTEDFNTNGQSHLFFY